MAEKNVLKNKLEKLMKNIDKPIEIPQRKDKKPYDGPDFVRNVMGSSAGAGSGEFHVYRHLRRKEYARQKHIEIEAKLENLDELYKQKLEKNRQEAEARTAKKRQKRLKKNKKQKVTKTKPNEHVKKIEGTSDSQDESDSSQEAMDGGSQKPQDNFVHKESGKMEQKSTSSTAISTTICQNDHIQDILSHPGTVEIKSSDAPNLQPSTASSSSIANVVFTMHSVKNISSDQVSDKKLSNQIPFNNHQLNSDSLIDNGSAFAGRFGQYSIAFEVGCRCEGNDDEILASDSKMYGRNSPKVPSQSEEPTQDSLRQRVHQRGSGNARAQFKRKAQLFMLLLRYVSRISAGSATSSSVNNENAKFATKCSANKSSSSSTFNICLDCDSPTESDLCATNKICEVYRKSLKRKVSLDASGQEGAQKKFGFGNNKKIKPSSDLDAEHTRHQQRRRSSQFYIFINSNYEINVLNDEQLDPAQDQNESQTKCSQIEEIPAPDLESFFSLDTLDEQQALRLIHSATIGQGSFGRVLRSKFNGQNLAIKVTMMDFYCDCKGERNGLRLNQHLNVAKTHHIIKLRSQSVESPLQFDSQKCVSSFSQRNFEAFGPKEAKDDLLTVSERTRILLLGLLGKAIQTVLGGEVQLVLMELAGDMSLQQVIDDHLEQRLDKRRRFILLRQICSALEYLKRNRIAHLDLKPANLMVNRSTNIVKLVDFGCSKEITQKCLPLTNSKKSTRFSVNSPNRLTVNPLDASFFMSSLAKLDDYKDKEEMDLCNRECKCSVELSIPDSNVGTIIYTAPEIFRKTVVDYFQADIFSLGITMWQMASRQTPYSGENAHSIIYRVASGRLRPQFSEAMRMDESMYCELASRMWAHDPMRRPTIHQISAFVHDLQ